MLLNYLPILIFLGIATALATVMMVLGTGTAAAGSTARAA